MLSAVVPSSMSLESATNASSFHGNSQFLQMLFEKYGKEGVIPYDAFERLLRRVGIVVVPQSDHNGRKFRSEQAQAPHPFHDHRNESGTPDHTETVGHTTTHGSLRTGSRRCRGEKRVDGAKVTGGDPTLRGHSREKRAFGKHNPATGHVAQQVKVSI